MDGSSGTGEAVSVPAAIPFINSQAYTVMGAIAAQGTVVMVERFSASRFWPDMKEYDIDVFNYIGSMMAVLLKREKRPASASTTCEYLRRPVTAG